MRRVAAVLLGMGAMALLAGSASAALGPHAGHGASGGDCAACHDSAPSATLRGWGMTADPGSALQWYTRPIAKLCWSCHRTGGGGAGATNMDAFAYDNLSHGFDTGTVGRVDAFAAGVPESYGTTGLPYAGGAALDCTSCHNVHSNTYRPFSMKGTSATDFSPLCGTCHAGRVNAGSVGTTNSFTVVAGGDPYSTHPTDIVIGDLPGNLGTSLVAAGDPTMNVLIGGGAWTLGGHRADGTSSGSFSCQTCHAVHGYGSGAGVHYPGLLVLRNDARPSLLCKGCHNGGDVGETVGTTGDDHPVDALTGRTFYPAASSFATPTLGIPVPWRDASRRDRGAIPFDASAGARQTPACSSCHDAHGGLPGGSTLWGPVPAGAGDWCFSCHAQSGVIPAGHHSSTATDDDGVTFTSALGCGDCHGTTAGSSWGSHNGFSGFVVAPGAGNSSLCLYCHTDTAPRTLKAGYVQPNWPSLHGTDRGDASHYLGPDTDEFAGVAPKLTAWPTTGYYSEYGGQTGGGLTAPSGPGPIICESCHSMLYNDGAKNPANYPSGGWAANLLLEPYEDDPAGIGDGTGAYGVGDALCTGCHATAAGWYHHPIGSGLDMTKADATSPAAPRTLSMPSSGVINCDSCHRPHDADSDSVTAAGTHGHATATSHILEVDGAGHDWSTLCDECHAKK